MKGILCLCLVLSMSTIGQAQSDSFRKVEFFGGYSLMNFDNAAGNTNNATVNDVLGGRELMQGFNASITGNFSRYWGVKFDYSLHLREDSFTRPLGSGTVDSSLHNFLFGIQVKNNSRDDPIFKPFGHGLVGFAVQKIDVDSPQLPVLFGVNDFSVNETSLAFGLGGGIDLKLNDRLDVRLGQIDWNIVRRGDQQILGITPGQTIVLPNTRQDNLRFSVGIVIH